MGQFPVGARLAWSGLIAGKATQGSAHLGFAPSTNLVGAASAATGGEAVVEPESAILQTYREHRFYGRCAANRG